MSITLTLHRTFHIINCSVYFLLLLMQLLFFLLVPFQDFFATMSSDELKKTSNIKEKFLSQHLPFSIILSL